LKALDAFINEALTPLADSVPVTAQLGGNLLVGRVVLGGEQDDAATEDQGLRGGTGADKGLELVSGCLC
jgi:hypothetical protein